MAVRKIISLVNSSLEDTQYRYEIVIDLAAEDKIIAVQHPQPKASQGSVFLAFVVIFRIGVHLTQLLIILLKTGQVLSGLCKLSLLHAFTHIPVDERTLSVHQVELVVKTRPGLSDGSGVAQHAHGPLDFGQIPTRNCSWRSVINANLLRQRE